MGHTVDIVDHFGGAALLHRRYKNAQRLEDVLDASWAPRKDTGHAMGDSALLESFDGEDAGALMVDGAEDGDTGFFDLSDLRGAASGADGRALLLSILAS
jgi:hypothetical protein